MHRKKEAAHKSNGGCIVILNSVRRKIDFNPRLI